MKTAALGLSFGILLVSGARQTGSPSGGAGFVLEPRDGETLSVRNGEVVIKVDPRTGSARFAMGTQTLRPGAGIGVHLHEKEDEILFVHSGKGLGVVGDDQAAVEPGSTIFIPHGVWHGVENPDGELSLVWVVSPPGLESFFRDSGSPPDAPAKVLTAEQLEDIRRKHGMRTKPR
jgi:mannose-6-phosphate isomerase-like protein (cupin superfamily)